MTAEDPMEKERESNLPEEHKEDYSAPVEVLILRNLQKKLKIALLFCRALSPFRTVSRWWNGKCGMEWFHETKCWSVEGKFSAANIHGILQSVLPWFSVFLDGNFFCRRSRESSRNFRTLMPSCAKYWFKLNLMFIGPCIIVITEE